MRAVATAPELVRLRRADAVSAQAAALLERAARFDAEMGFGAPRHSTPVDGSTTVVEVDTCLHRHDVPHPEDYVLAAVVVVRRVRPGTAVVELVVDPERRSIGVATAVVEAVGTDPSAGWADPEVRTLRACAYGSHPAAERVARRFGVRRTGVRHHLVLPADERPPPGPEPRVRVDGPGEGHPDEPGRPTLLLDVAPGHARVAHAGPDRPAEILGVEVPDAPHGARREALVRVIAGAVDHLRRAGAGAVEALVDGADEDVLEAFRTQRFEHDRSDLLFQVPAAARR